MYTNFEDLLKESTPIGDRTLYIEKILFDEYKLLEKLGFCVNYSLISDLPNNEAVNAKECLENNKIDDISNEQIIKFIKINRHEL